MKFPSLLFIGILSTVYGIYKIPEHDACALRVLLCDDFTKPLTPVDNSTLEMFETIGELNAICEELSKFRICLKNAEKFCEEHSDLDVGFELLKNRRLAFDLCVRGSSHQHVYMMVEGCVNKYSHSAIEFCTDKAVETVGLDFDLGDYESECRFLGEIQHCHIAVVTDKCGSIAGNLLERLVVFRGERDFMCIGYENERLKNLEEFHATMDSYVQQYRNIIYQIGKEDESGRTDWLKDLKTTHKDHMQDRISREFHSRISPISVEDCAPNKEHTSYRERPFNSERCSCTKKPSCPCSSEQKNLDFSMPQETVQHLRHFYEQRNGKVLSDENYACKIKASFLVTLTGPNGEHHHLGFGVADILWSTYSPLLDLSCAWIVNPTAPSTLNKCSIMIDHSTLVIEACKRGNCELPFKTTLAVYEIVNESEAKRVAELRVHSFLEYPTLERGLYKINLFKKNAHNIRYWCSEKHEEQDSIQSTNRKGLVPSEIKMYDMTNGQSKIFDQKYNFYSPEHSEYPKDTEIYLSSRDKNLESELEVKDNVSPQNYDENLNSFVTEEIFYENNLAEKFALRPSTSSKSSSHLYRPYELFRPRLGETLETPDQDVSSQNLGTKDAAESSTNLDMLLFEDYFENGCASRLYAEKMCPILPENVSKLVNKLATENHVNMADSLDVINSKHPKMFQISEKRENVPLSNTIWKAEEPKDINTDDQQNKFEEIYVVTPSAEIETARRTDRMVDEYADTYNLDDFQISNIKGDSKEYAEVSQDRDCFKSLTLEKGSILQSANARNSKVDFLEMVSSYQNNEHPFSNNFVETSKSYEVASEEKFSPKSTTFSRRSDQKDSNEMKELINTFEILAKMKIQMSRIHKMLKESLLKNGKNTSLRYHEL